MILDNASANEIPHSTRSFSACLLLGLVKLLLEKLNQLVTIALLVGSSEICNCPANRLEVFGFVSLALS